MNARRRPLVRFGAGACLAALPLFACGRVAEPPEPRALPSVAPRASAPEAPAAVRTPARPVGLPPQAAYLVIDAASGRELGRAHPEVLDTPLLPGSIAKVAVLAAALEARVVTRRTRLMCRRETLVGRTRLTCAHPDLGYPLNAVEALAHSCNAFFVAVAERLSRETLNAWRIDLGLPPIAVRDPFVLAALGLAGPEVTPRALVWMLPRIAQGSGRTRLQPATRGVLLEGLRGAATYGTAAVLSHVGMDVLAKTGTAPTPGGQLGLIVAFRLDRSAGPPGAGLSAVVVAPGASGRDASMIAVDVLRETAASTSTSLRVGESAAVGFRIVAVPLEELVARAVSGEAAPDMPPAALEAVAIAARTFALGNRDRHGREGFDLCGLTHCLALREAGAAAVRATRATTGQGIRDGDRPAGIWLSASCGGHTAVPSEIWSGTPGDDSAPLVPRLEPACRVTSHWRAEIAERDLARALHAAGLRGDLIRDLVVTARTDSGRVARLRIEGFEPNEITAEAFRLAVGRALGWNLVRSHLFTVTRTGTGFSFDGFGFGHGVGLCLGGAARLAAEGHTAEEILRAYFPGARMRAAATGDAPQIGS